MPERTFDYVTRHDPRSRAYAIRGVAPVPVRAVWWTGGPVLDQGQEGSCVGHGVAGELAASPVRVAGITHEYAVGVYLRAKQVDEWDGVDYDGTSVLAGMKVGTERGLYDGYRWCFSMDDVKVGLTLGPVVIGVNWYDSLYEAPGGRMTVAGDLVGGHCVVVTGWSPNYARRGETYRLRNSWGRSWGAYGNGYIPAADLKRLLIDEQGEAAVPVGRHLLTGA